MAIELFDTSYHIHGFMKIKPQSNDVSIGKYYISLHFENYVYMYIHTCIYIIIICYKPVCLNIYLGTLYIF